jgi:hypothetical protein
MDVTMNVKDLTEKQRDALRVLNEIEGGAGFVSTFPALALERAKLVERAGNGVGKRGKLRVRLTEAGVRAANELVGGSAA